jgi:hypothetical protein
MSYVFMSKKANSILKNAIQQDGHSLIEVEATVQVYPGIASHADIYLCSIGGELVVAPEQLSNLEQQLTTKGYSFSDGFICTGLDIGSDTQSDGFSHGRLCGFSYAIGKTNLTAKYPGTIPYNAAVFGNYFMHNLSFTDTLLLEKARGKGLTLIDVAQGYTKCNTVVVDDNAIITSDPGIAAAASMFGIDVLTISQGHVLLEGFDYGFLGGASGRIGDKIYFNGDLSAHPDCQQIITFIASRGLHAKFFPVYPLEDIGSIIVVDNKRSVS